MTELRIPLNDIMLDPEQEVDLLSLPEEEALEAIKEGYRFLSPDVEVSIEDGVARIAVEYRRGRSAAEVAKLYKRAVKHAERANYERAIRAFTVVINEEPDNAEARRNLGMSHVESGNIGQGKKHVIEAIRLDPTDAWAYLLLANIYMKHEHDLDTAQKLYQRAYELNPEDPYLLTSYAALYVERGEPKEARSLFERSIEIAPSYPNARYGLALLYMRDNDLKRAKWALEDLFAQPLFEDIRSGQVYDEARSMYLEVNKRWCEESYDVMMEAVNDMKESLEERTGVRIETVEDDSIGHISAVAEMASKHNRDFHRIRYRVQSPGTVPHLLAHELEHISMEHEARKLGRNRLFTTTARSKQAAVPSIQKAVEKLRRAGYPETAIENVSRTWVEGLALQLFSAPIDMIIEHRLFQNRMALRPSQFVSLHVLYLEALAAFTDSNVRDISPQRIYRANTALNCANALFVDWLFDGATDYSTPYQRDSRALRTGQRLFSLWEDCVDSFEPGDEYDLVDEFARVLRLQDWFEWQADDSQPSRPEGTTNPELLKAKEPASVMYCLDALRRFENMTDEQVSEVASEIALLGQRGIDYASSDRDYTLRSVPGEQFSGLHLLCLMYVGLRRVAPHLDQKLDLGDAYEAALMLHKAES